MKKAGTKTPSFFMAQPAWTKWNQLRAELVKIWQIAANLSFEQIV
jgi:hypothetical protein